MRRQRSLDEADLLDREVIGNHVDPFAARLVNEQVGGDGDELVEVYRAADLRSTPAVRVVNATFGDSVPSS